MTQVQIKSNTNYRNLISFTNGDIQMVITMFEDSIEALQLTFPNLYLMKYTFRKHRYMISGKEY